MCVCRPVRCLCGVREVLDCSCVFADNGIGAAGASSLSDALKVNSTVTSVNVSGALVFVVSVLCGSPFGVLFLPVVCGCFRCRLVGRVFGFGDGLASGCCFDDVFSRCLLSASGLDDSARVCVCFVLLFAVFSCRAVLARCVS